MVRNPTSGDVYARHDATGAVITAGLAESATGRQLFVAVLSRSTSTVQVYAVAEDGTISFTPTVAVGADALTASGSAILMAGAETSAAAAIGHSIGLADAIDDNLLTALHRMLALGELGDTDGIGRVFGGLTVQERAALTLNGEPYTTANRPAVGDVAVGTMIFDTTLGQPIFNDGTNWVDATGTTV